MKIGIVTHMLFHNYGGILQNYALQQILIRLGHYPITIDYLPNQISKWHYFLAQCKTCCSYILLNRSRKFFLYPQRKRNIDFCKFMQKHLVLTETVKSYSSSIIKKNNIEAVIVGSDQTWRAAFYKSEILPDMYLRFMKNISIPKIAYAASFGVDYWEYSPDLTLKCGQLAKMFQAISVRENSGIELCKEYLGVDAVEVLDPTLLLDKDDYEQLCLDIPHEQGKFILVYILDMSPEKKVFIEALAQKMALPVKYYTSEKEIVLSIEEWLAMFRDASFVITDSFHGSVFSIIYNKDFYSIINEWRGGSRFYSLLSHFSLESRIVTDLTQIPDGEIDWNIVNKSRFQYQTESIQYLKDNLIN